MFIAYRQRKGRAGRDGKGNTLVDGSFTSPKYFLECLNAQKAAGTHDKYQYIIPGSTRSEPFTHELAVKYTEYLLDTFIGGGGSMKVTVISKD